MNSISQNVRYLPHDLNTKFYAVCAYRNGSSSNYVCRKYHISKSSLSRWNKKFDGTKESLIDKSHKPKSKHPKAHTDLELKWIQNYIKRNPHITLCELWYKLKINKLGMKWQIDVKYVPDECKCDNLPEDKKFYQYTCIDEASRERFIYHYDSHTPMDTVDFVHRCFLFYEYKPKEIQTDNGVEFTWNQEKIKKIHPLDKLCIVEDIYHHKIKPRTPRHNGKVERSHRSDNERFYNTLKFYSLEDLRYQAKLYLKRSNNIPMAVLNYKTPKEQRVFLLNHNCNS